MAELRIDRPRVLAILGTIDVCDQVEAPGGSTLLRVSPNEVMLVGTDDADVVGAGLLGSDPLQLASSAAACDSRSHTPSVLPTARPDLPGWRRPLRAEATGRCD